MRTNMLSSHLAAKRSLLAPVAIALLCFACKKADADAADAGAVSNAGASADASAQAGGNAATASSTAAWYPPGSNQEVKLTWAVYPKLSESEAGDRRNLEVVARIGDAVKRVMLGPQDGTLVAGQQSVCNPSLKTGDTVSVIRFHTMGPKTIVARRVQPGLLEISFVRDADDAPSKLRGVLTTIPIPADARIVDAISDIRGAGAEGPFDCSSQAGAAGGKAATVTGKAKVSSRSFMPGGKDPSGLGNASFGVQVSEMKIAPPIVASLTDVEFEPLALPLKPAPGNATVTAPSSKCSAHVKSARSGLDVTFWEPKRNGCVTPDEREMAKGFNATVKGKLKDGSPVTLTFALAAAQ